MMPLDDISRAAIFLKDWCEGGEPEVAVVLGSGWSPLLSHLKNGRFLSFDALPGFPPAGVSGHRGCVWRGDFCGIRILAFEGRYHFYEGYSAWQTTAIIRLISAIGCRRVLLTNASGGISGRLSPGTFMLVTDHINFSTVNPLIGRPEREFVDLHQLYNNSIYHDLKERLIDSDVRLESGILAWMPGPYYETPAEISALERMGADAVSMSTVHEALMARYCGLDVIAIALIANQASGKADAPLCHEDVLKVGHAAGSDAYRLLDSLFSLL